MSKKASFVVIISFLGYLFFYFINFQETISPLRIGTHIWPGYEPLYIARENGYFDESQIKIIEFTSATDVMRAFRDNQIHAGALTLDETMILIDQGIDLTIIMVADVSDGADMLISLEGIRSAQELIGKKIGVESTALGKYVLTRFLKINEIELSDVQVIYMEISNHLSAYKNQDVDAIFTFEPEASKMLKLGGNKLFNSRQIPDEIIDIISVKSEYLQKGKGNVQKLVEAWYRAIGFIEEKPHAAAEIMQYRLGISPSEVLESLKGLKFPDMNENKEILNFSSGTLIKSSDILNEIMVRNNSISKPVNITNSIYTE